MEGSGGIIFDLGGKLAISFACGLGIKTNNEAEWISLLHRLEISANLNINHLLVIGDSKKVILKMHQGGREEIAKGVRIYKRIHHLNIPSSTSFFHVKRENNGIAYKLENEGVRKKLGVVMYDNNTKVNKCVLNL